MGQNRRPDAGAQTRILADAGWGAWLDRAGGAAPAGRVAADLWRQHLGPSFEDSLRDLMTSAGTLRGRGKVHAMRENLWRMATPSPELRAALELVVVSLYNPWVSDAVMGEALAPLRQHLAGSSVRNTPTRAAQRAYVTALGLGLAGARRSRPVAVDWEQLVRDLRAALAHPAPPSAEALLPRADHISQTIYREPGGGVAHRLMTETLAEVALRGFDEAAVPEIAHRSGVPEGALFDIHPDKAALFREATQRQQKVCLGANDAFLREVGEAQGPGVADAVGLREFQRPDFAFERVLALEQLRLSWHDRTMLRLQDEILDPLSQDLAIRHPEWPPDRVAGEVHLGYALGVGAYFLAVLVPDAYRLPFEVVTIPLLGG